MLRHQDNQLDFHDELLNDLVSLDHVYRKLKRLINFEKLLSPLASLYSDKGKPSEPVERGFKCLLIQLY